MGDREQTSIMPETLEQVRIDVPSGSVKAVLGDDGQHRLLVLGAPHGSRTDLDWDGQFFSEKTDFMMDIGDNRPVIYMHGRGPDGKPLQNPEVVGKATAIKRDEKGLWFEVLLDITKTLGKRLWEKALQGLVKASTGCVAHMFRQGAFGEILKWNIGELSLLDVGDKRRPANLNAVAIALKSVYDDAEMEFPEAWVQGSEELAADAVEPEPVNAPEIQVSAIAAAVLSWFDHRDAAAQAEVDLYTQARAEVDAEMAAAEAAALATAQPAESEPFKFRDGQVVKFPH